MGLLSYRALITVELLPLISYIYIISVTRVLIVRARITQLQEIKTRIVEQLLTINN